jgi:hypothetical protein
MKRSSLEMKSNREPIKGRLFAATGPLGLLLVIVLLCSSPHLTGQKSPVDQNVFANKAGSTSFAFELSQGMVIVPVSIHGSRPLRFVLDSGSTRTLVDRALAASLGLKEGAASSLQGAGQGRIPIHTLHDVDLRIPGLDSKGYDCFIVDLAPLEQTLGTREDGILGYDFFARFVLTVDFEARRLTVELPAVFHPRSLSEELPLEKVRKMAANSMESDAASSFFEELLPKDSKSLSNKAQLDHKTMMALFASAPGQRLHGAKETLWGAVNAVTYYADHIRSGTDGDRLDSAWFGAGCA